MGKTQSTGNLTNGISQDSSNNIGIGAAPSGSYKFEVTGTSKFSDNVLINNSSNLLSSLTIKSSSSTTGLQLYLYGLNATLSNQDNGSLAFQTNGIDRLTISSTGAATFSSSSLKVINTSGSADFILDRANTSSGAAFNLNTNGTNKWFFGLRGLANDDFYIYNQTAGANNLILSASTGAATFSSNVGIGGSPSAAASLDVRGGNVWIRTPTAIQGIQFGYSDATHGSYRAAVMGGPQSYGASDDGMLTFHTQAGYVVSSTPPERMRITGAGNVGIGTTSPSNKLDIQAANGTAYTSTAQLRVGGGGVNNNWAQILFSDNALSDGKISYYAAAAEADRMFSISARTTQSDFIIKGNGNVGIGTSSPTAASGLGLNKFIDIAGATVPGIVFHSSNGTQECALGTGAEGLSIGAYGAATASKNIINFFTSDTNSSNSITERMRIKANGYSVFSNYGTYVTAAGNSAYEFNSNTYADTFYISNTATWNNTNNWLLRLEIPNATTRGTTDKFIYATAGGAIRFYVGTNGDVRNENNSYGAISDVKLKENITDATPKLDDLLKVKIRNYNFKGTDIKQIGVIAQELEEIFPSMIDETPDTNKNGDNLNTSTKSVKYSVFVPMLIKAIQEQQAQIEELKQLIK